MKIIVTGSLGHISKPLAQLLVQQGHSVTVISSAADRAKDIEALGATAAIGSLEDVAFLTATFTGADAVYCMTPPNFAEPDYLAYTRRSADKYVQAIAASGVRRVVHLSSYGADLDSGTGLILGKHYAEQVLSALPGISVTHLRPAYFYYNLLAFVDAIKNTGNIYASYGADKLVLVAPEDIATVAAEELQIAPPGSHIRYIASDELTGQEIAAILGAAIGKPGMQWIIIPDEQAYSAMTTHGVPPHIARDMVDMFHSLRTGALSAHYNSNRPATLGSTKLADVAPKFAVAFNR